MKKHNFILIFAFAAVTLAIYFQALQPLWRWHLEMDVFAFFEKVEHFTKFHTFAGIAKNEYLPGAVWFFMLISVFTEPLTLANYYPVLFLFNFILLGLSVIIYKRYGSFINALLFLLVTLVSGPYLLYRFELLTSVLLLSSLILFKKEKINWSYFVLGVAISVKLYPVIILPYYMIMTVKEGKKNVFMYFLSFLAGIFLTFGMFLMAGGRVGDIFASLNYHSQKPIGVESIPATIITAKSLIQNGMPPKISLGNSVWGLVGDYDLNLFGWVWIIPIGFFYIYLFFKEGMNKGINFGIVFLLILVFLIFSKNLNPQYLFWFISLFPLMKAKNKEGEGDYLILFALILLISYLNQCIYPLLFNDFLGKFYNEGQNWEIFYLQAVKNISLIILLFLSIRHVFVKKSIE